jgi:hypothetical protein
VSAKTDSQLVQLWPNSPRGQHQQQFIVLTSLPINRSPDLHHRQQQQQQQSPMLAMADSSAGRTGCGSQQQQQRRPPPCEAQTWLVMEYCNGG